MVIEPAKRTGGGSVVPYLFFLRGLQIKMLSLLVKTFFFNCNTCKLNLGYDS